MKKVSKIIQNATIYTVNKENEVIKNGHIAIDNGVIEKVCKSDAELEAYESEDCIDAKGKVVFPGFVNTHIHIFQSLLKGLGADHKLIDWLNLSALPYGEKMEADLQYAGALLACREALQSGCTTLGEHFYTTQTDDLAHAVIKGMQETGIRSVFMRTFWDTGTEYGAPSCFMETADVAMKRTEAIVNQYNRKSDMLHIWTGPCVTWGTTKRGYECMMEYVRQSHIPYSMHINETLVDNAMTQRYYGKNAVDLLDDAGFLTDDFLAVHCVNLTDREMNIFAEKGVNISHNVMSNMYLASGFAEIPKMLKKNITVSLGTDGAASNNTTNYLESMKMAAMVQKGFYRNASIITANQILRMATIEGAKALKLDSIIGSIEEGKKADIIIFNPTQLTSFPMHDPLATLIYSSALSNIETTIVNGEVVYHKGIFEGEPDMQRFYHETFDQLMKIQI